MRSHALLLLFLLPAASLSAQKQQREPLTEAQVEQIAEAGIDPPGRVNLYVKFLNERADVIKGLTTRAKGAARGERLAGELQDFAALVDELGDNLDVYSDRKADIRKSLKPLNESIARWRAILTALPSEPDFEISRKDALDATGDLADQAKKITTDLTAYFDQHKDEKGQDRAEPKATSPQH
jgi:hypothetical protein